MWTWDDASVLATVVAVVLTLSAVRVVLNLHRRQRDRPR
jgi:hypothetical protein